VRKWVGSSSSAEDGPGVNRIRAIEEPPETSSLHIWPGLRIVSKQIGSLIPERPLAALDQTRIPRACDSNGYWEGVERLNPPANRGNIVHRLDRPPLFKSGHVCGGVHVSVWAITYSDRSERPPVRRSGIPRARRSMPPSVSAPGEKRLRQSQIIDDHGQQPDQLSRRRSLAILALAPWARL